MYDSTDFAIPFDIRVVLGQCLNGVRPAAMINLFLAERTDRANYSLAASENQFQYPFKGLISLRKFNKNTRTSKNLILF